MVSRPAAPWRVKGKRVYRGFSQEELDAGYDVEATVAPAEHQRCRDHAAAEGARVCAALDHRLDVAYGAGDGERLDIFPASKPGAPVAVYIHGGYWRHSAKEACHFLAQTFVGAGAAYVSVEYGRAPAVTVDEIVRQCRAATAWVQAHAAEFNGDAGSLHVMGHSVGGQLAGMVAATDWAAFGVEGDPVRSVAVTSGLYDLEPVRLSFVNEWARLDKEGALRNSPLHHIPARLRPAVVGWGADETGEFRRQSQDFAVALQARGWPARTFAVEGRHHFDVAHVLADPGHAMTRAVLANMGL